MFVRFAGAETAPLAVAPSAFGAVEWGDLVLVEGAGFPPAAALECAFEGSEPEVPVELTGSTGGDASSETGGVASARVLENGGDPAATRFARTTPRRAGETLDAARAACAPPPAGFLLDRITLRWRGVVLAAARLRERRTVGGAQSASRPPQPGPVAVIPPGNVVWMPTKQ